MADERPSRSSASKPRDQTRKQQTQTAPSASQAASNAHEILWDPPENFQSKYRVLYAVGEGSYGIVYKVVSRDDEDRVFAVKVLKFMRQADGVPLATVREMTLLRELSHDNIIACKEVFIDTKQRQVSMLLEYARCDILTILRYHRQQLAGAPLDADVLRRVLWQLLNALRFLHRNWVIHRDIKPSNIMVVEGADARGTVKLCDFGLARSIIDPVRSVANDGVVVTLWYRAPELLLGAPDYDFAVDMWATGCIFAELLNLVPLFRAEEVNDGSANAFQAKQVDKIFRVLGTPSPDVWYDITKCDEWETVRTWPKFSSGLERAVPLAAKNPVAFDLLQRMLTYDPKKRITAKEALEHRFFSSLSEPERVFPAEKSVPYPQRSPISADTLRARKRRRDGL